MTFTPAAEPNASSEAAGNDAAAVLGGDDVVGLDLLLDGRSVEPRRPAPSVATTVTSARPIISAAAVEAVRPGLRSEFSRASRPGEPPRRRRGSRRRRQRLHQARGEHGDADEQREHADGERSAIASTPPNRPGAIRASETPTTAMPAYGLAARAGRRRAAPSRTAEIGGTRVARSAGTMLATSVTIVPVSMLTMTVRVASTVPDFGRSTPIAANSALMPLAMPSAEQRGRCTEASRPTIEAFEHDRAHDLTPRGAERAQRRELARALGDGDRERVEDHERAHEQRDAAEAEQEVGDELQALVGVLGVGRGLGVAGLDLGGLPAAAA